MLRKESRSHLILGLLTIILVTLIIAAIRNMYLYYTSSGYVVDRYIKCLNERDYKEIYKLLDQEQLAAIGSQEEIINYYARQYEKENKLKYVKKLGMQKEVYRIGYYYKEHSEEGQLEVVKKQHKWYVVFPFKWSQVSVYAPYGCQVYLDNTKLDYKVEGMYGYDKVLPGTYLLSVHFPMDTYKDYYQAVHIPQEKQVVLDYPVGSLQINSMKGLEVHINQFKKTSQKVQLLMPDLLVGQYEIQMIDPRGYIAPQMQTILLGEEGKKVSLKDFHLTEKGEQKLEDFLDTFYNHYESAILERSKVPLIDDFEQAHQENLLNEFSSWYIDKKQIVDAKVQTQYGDYSIDQDGYLHQQVTENVILYNQEMNEHNEQVTKVYQVHISWDMSIDVLKENWQIQNRSLLESVVAIQDQEGKWIQY